MNHVIFFCFCKVQDSVTSSSPTRSVLITEKEKKLSKTHNKSTDSTSSDDVIIKRRGKKRKGKKTLKERGKEGEKEFKGIPDPNETQVSAIGSDSMNSSSRHSFSGDEKTSENMVEEIIPTIVKEDVEIDENKKSFLSKDILKQLQRQLDQEVVDSELNFNVRSNYVT